MRHICRLRGAQPSSVDAVRHVQHHDIRRVTHDASSQVKDGREGIESQCDEPRNRAHKGGDESYDACQSTEGSGEGSVGARLREPAEDVVAVAVGTEIVAGILQVEDLAGEVCGHSKHHDAKDELERISGIATSCAMWMEAYLKRSSHVESKSAAFHRDVLRK